jgi:glucose/mannose-6-phosphate isomerase
MKDDIYNFPKQLLFSPEIINKEKWGTYNHYLLSGMGGSHLQGEVLLSLYRDLPLSIYSDYGLPNIKKDTGVIIASYSGNTEETIDNFNTAISSGLDVAVISKGGKLIELAEERFLPYIKIPEGDVQPRMGMGYALKSVLKMMNVEKQEIEEAVEYLEKKKDLLMSQGKEIAALLKSKIPIVYSSTRNIITSKIWKINFNEGPKIPSFYNTIPELNHNEMTGFDVSLLTKELSQKMVFILLRDDEDDPRNERRMDVLKTVLEKRNFSVFEINIKGEKREEKIFSSIILSAWTAYYLAEFYNNNPNVVPMVEEFKDLIK